MRPDETIPKPARLTPRRVAWGSLLADAPWDGRPREAAPIHVPATAAGRAATPDYGDPELAATPRSRKRVPFGVLLATAPWAARPVATAPAVAPELARIAAAV